MSKSIRLEINYTAEAEKRHFIQTGETLVGYSVKIDSTELNPEQRQAALDLEMFKHFNPVRSISTFKVEAVSRFGEPNPRPHISITQKKFDKTPRVEELLYLLEAMARQYKRAEEELATQVAGWEQRKLAIAEEAAILAKQILQDEEAAMKQKLNIQWADGTALVELEELIFIASGLEHDPRYDGWCKTVTGINYAKKDGYMYKGNYVNAGTCEIRKDDHTVYIVTGVTGSRKYSTTKYQVVELKNGKLVKHNELSTDSGKPGWALRLRDGIAALIGDTPQGGFTRIPADVMADVLVVLLEHDPPLHARVDQL